MKTVALDIETTGLDPQNDALIEIAIITFEDGKIIERWSTLLNPGRAIPQIVTTLTGITDDDLKNAPLLKKTQEVIEKKLAGAHVVGHFINFDISFLKTKGLSVPTALLDTYDLARVLLPKEKSYSLEVLTQKWNIEQTKKHRALYDTEATIALLHLLQQKITEIPEEKQKEIREILEKSTWAWKDCFLKNLKPVKEKTAKSASETKKEKLYGVHAVDHLPHNAENILYEPHEYLCLKKYKAYYEQKKQLTPEETTLALKIILYKKEVCDMTQHVFLPAKEEKKIWYGIAGDPISCTAECTMDTCGWIAARQKLQNTQSVTCTHMTLLRELKRKYSPLFKEERDITIEKIEHMPRTVAYAWTETIALDRFENFLQFIHDAETAQIKSKMELFFGILCILIEKEGTHDGWTKKLPFTPILQGNKNWEEARTMLNQMMILFRTLFEKQKKPVTGAIIALGHLLKVLEHSMRLDGQLSISAEISDMEQVKIYTKPKDTNADLAQLWAHEKISAGSDILTEEGIDTEFIRKQCAMPKNIPMQNTGSIQQLNATIEKNKDWTIAEMHDTMIILVSSKALQEKVYQELINKKLTDTQILAPQITGGKGKTIHQWQTVSKKNVILVCTFHWFLSERENLKEKTGENTALVIYNIPFPPPNKENPHSFTEETLPQTILTLKGAMYGYMHMPGGTKNLYIFDERIKNYDGILIKNLKPLVKIIF